MPRSPLVSLALVACASLSTFLSGSAFAKDAAFGRAEAAAAKGDYAVARKEYAGVSGAEAGDARLAEGRTALLLGRYDDAIALARAAANADPKLRGDAAALRARALAATGKTSEAIAACKEVTSDASRAAHRARIVLAELLLRTGKRKQIRAVLDPIIDDYNNDKINASDAEGLTLVARATQLLRHGKEASSAYKEAYKAGASRSVEMLLWRAELFLDWYDPGDAGADVKEALKLAPKDPTVHAALARVKLENGLDFEGAESEITQALEVNPTLPEAHFIRAGLSLRDLDIGAADRAADRGLATNPGDLELLSMKAATRFLADDPAGYEAVKRKVLGLDPEYSKFFLIVGEYAEWEHRYDDIVRMMREATTVDAQDAKAWAQLGLNLIRAGNDVDGAAALEKSRLTDKANVRVYNTLNFLDVVKADYVTTDGTPFRIRYAKGDKAILERYVPQMLDEAWASMVKRYGFTPKVPVQIELYADDEQFSIRTSGLPHVGIQGVCFGQTLAALSPSAAAFNWGNVLWHELGHVFAIQMSKNHVPRWFTEGLSEYETIIRRPEWQREEDPALYAALKGGRVPEIASFNRAFTHAHDVSDVTMAYYAASQIQVFLAEEFGFPKAVAMLPKWGAGQRTEEIVRSTLGVSSEELDRRFRAWLMAKKLSRYAKQYVPDLHAPPLDEARKAVKKEPRNAKRYVELALALLEDRQKEEGDAMLSEALRFDPKQPDAHFVKVKLALGKKDAAEAARLLNKMIADGNDGYAVRLVAASIAERLKDKVRLKLNLEQAHKLDPSQDDPVRDLLHIARDAHDDAAELTLLRELARIDQHDRKTWGLLLQKLVERGLWAEAVQVGEGAMFVDVKNASVHRLYARALARTGRFVSAVYELNSALVCKPRPADQAAIYGELAKAYDKLGKPDLAAQARRFQGELPKPDLQQQLDDAAHGKKRGAGGDEG